MTVAAFSRFAQEGYQNTDLWSPSGRKWLEKNPQGAGANTRAAGRSADHPVVAVTWYEAEAYCRWSGGSLPTEAQWELAACGAESNPGQRFAWGDDDSIDAVWYSGGKFGHLQNVRTQPADRQDPALHAPGGLMHMSGNVWEWTMDWYDRDGTAEDGLTDPTGPESGTWKTLRGGSYMNLPSYCSCTHREPARPDRVAFTAGFRCIYP